MTEAHDHEGVMVRSGPFDGEPSPASIAKVAACIEQQGLGGPAVTYRLRDSDLASALLGRPIPIIHDEHGEVAVPLDDLPVRLPDDVDFRPGGESPLARHDRFVKTSCPTCGRDARRDTDTMDTFVDSSWYFFRYCSPGEGGPFREDVERWPVSQYTGGVEHAILHLMYARFFTKALYDAGMVPFIEPFARMMNQGQVIYGGGSMSKSKGNIVEPMPLVERWGADSMRLTMLFANPFEDDIDWKLIAGDADHRPGVHHWLGRVFAAVGSGRARCGRADDAGAAHAPHDRRGDGRSGAVPVQRGDLEAHGPDERDADRARRRRRGTGSRRSARADARAVRAVRRRGALARGARS